MPIHMFWKILSEYISAKDQESAAHHLVNELIDAGAEEDDLWEMCKGNPLLRRVVNEFLDDDEDEQHPGEADLFEIIHRCIWCS